MKEFSQIDISQMDNVTFRVSLLFKIMVAILALLFLVPSLELLLAGIVLLVSGANIQNLPLWGQNNTVFVSLIVLLVSSICLVIGIFSLYKLIDYFKSAITIKNDELLVTKLRNSYTISLHDIQEVVGFTIGYSTLGRHVRWITLKLTNGTEKKVKTGSYEPRDILKLIPYLNEKALMKNTQVSLSDFYKTKWV